MKATCGQLARAAPSPLSRPRATPRRATRARCAVQGCALRGTGCCGGSSGAARCRQQALKVERHESTVFGMHGNGVKAVLDVHRERPVVRTGQILKSFESLELATHFATKRVQGSKVDHKPPLLYPSLGITRFGREEYTRDPARIAGWLPCARLKEPGFFVVQKSLLFWGRIEERRAVIVARRSRPNPGQAHAVAQPVQNLERRPHLLPAADPTPNSLCQSERTWTGRPARQLTALPRPCPLRGEAPSLGPTREGRSSV